MGDSVLMQGGMNISVGAEWIAGTRTYTLTRIWMHHEGNQWTPWVAFEEKWKKRTRHGHWPWAKFLLLLESEQATLQESPAVQRWDALFIQSRDKP